MAAEEQDLRQRLSAVLDGISDDTLREVVGGALTLEKLTTAECPSCGERTRVLVPDYRGFTAALAALTDQGKGKAATAIPAPPKEASLEDLEKTMRKVFAEMSDAQLQSVSG